MALQATILRADQPLTFYSSGENHEELKTYPLRSDFDVGCVHDGFRRHDFNYQNQHRWDHLNDSSWNHLNDCNWNHLDHRRWNYFHDRNRDYLDYSNRNNLYDKSRCLGEPRNSRLHSDDVHCRLVTFGQFERGSVKLARFPFKNQSNCEKTVRKTLALI